MTRATGWKGNERKILRYAQNDNSNAVSAKELHNFPYLCRTPKPNKTKNSNPKRPKSQKHPHKTKKPKH